VRVRNLQGSVGAMSASAALLAEILAVTVVLGLAHATRQQIENTTVWVEKLKESKTER
jgi:hypothetical protein